MRYCVLGSSDLNVSTLCLGTMQFGWTCDEPTSYTILDTFLEAGGNFIDTADIYSIWVDGNPGGVSETIIGNWIRQRANRDKVIVATKARGRMWDGPDGEGLSRAHLTRAVDDSLRRLQTEYIDLYQLHWDDEHTPIEETLETLHSFVTAGKVRWLGVSNFSATRLEQSLAISKAQRWTSYVSLQPHYNLVHRNEFEAELRHLCQEHNLGVMPYSPLAGGFLTGKYRRGKPLPDSVRANSLRERCFNERGWTIIDTIIGIAQTYGYSVPHIALAWLFAQPTVTTPIIGANSVSQLQDVLGAINVTLSTESIDALNTASEE